MAVAARAAGVADLDDIHAEDALRDVEAVSHSRYRHHRANTSRASLPLSHRRSFSTTQGRLRADSQGRRPSTAFGDQTEGYNDDPEANGGAPQGGDVSWGPNHPCYPHMNPHVPQSSPLYEKTRIVRIKRDWMVAGDVAPAFSRIFPETLEPHVTEEQFRHLIDYINNALLRAYDPWRPRAWLDAILGLVTAWIYDDLGLTGMKSDIRALEAWIDRWNKEQGVKEGARIIQLRRTAFLSLDIQIPDPQVSTYVGGDTASFMDGGSVMTGGQDSRFNRGIGSNVGPTASSIYSAAIGTDAGAGTAQNQVDEPAVPAIPGKYLDEAREAVGRQTQQRDGPR